MAMKNSLELGMMQTSPRFTSGAPSGSNEECQAVGGWEGEEVRVLQRGRTTGGSAPTSPRFSSGAPSVVVPSKGKWRDPYSIPR